MLQAPHFGAEIKEDDESAERALRLFLAIDAQMTNFVWGFQRGEAEKKEDERDSFRLCESLFLKLRETLCPLRLGVKKKHNNPFVTNHDNWTYSLVKCKTPNFTSCAT